MDVFVTSSPDPHNDEYQHSTSDSHVNKFTNTAEESYTGPRTTIYILDSLGLSRSRVSRKLTNYLKLEARDKHYCFNTIKPSTRTIKVNLSQCILSLCTDSFCPKTPIQSNSTDCGVYLLHFAETFIKNFEKISETVALDNSLWQTKDIKLYRSKLKQRIIDYQSTLLP